MTFQDRVKAVSEFGFTERQAGFLVTVMLHSGMCVPRQYAGFAGTAYGHKVTRFFEKLVQRDFATVCDCLHSRAALYHVKHHALYRAIDQPHSRYRRPVAARQAIDRLMRLDAIVLHSDLVWLATEEESVGFFSLMAPSLTRERLPHVTVGRGATQRQRLFPDHQPVGVTTTGRVVFIYVVTAYDREPLRAFVQRHSDLFHALPGWTLRLVFPQPLADAAARLAGIVRDELRPLRPEVIRELKWYFGRRRSTSDPRALSFENPEFWEDQAAFAAPRFSAALPALADGRRQRVRGDLINRDRRRLGPRNRPDRITYLAVLISPPRSLGKPVPFMSKGVEGGETSSARSQPARSDSLPASDHVTIG